MKKQYEAPVVKKITFDYTTVVAQASTGDDPVYENGNHNKLEQGCIWTFKPGKNSCEYVG